MNTVLFLFDVIEALQKNFQPMESGIFFAITSPGWEGWGQFVERNCHCFWKPCVFFVECLGGLFGNFATLKRNWEKQTVDIGSGYHDFDGFRVFFCTQDFSSSIYFMSRWGKVSVPISKNLIKRDMYERPIFCSISCESFHR